jgi:hypothetical protein
MTSKLLENAWSAQDSFMFRIKTVTDPTACAKWYTQDKQRTDVRFCNGDKGLFVLRNVKSFNKQLMLSTPSGSTIKDVAGIANYNIRELPPS